MRIAKGIVLKVTSVLLFAVMSALIRGFGETVPVGQVVFFRSAFAIVPVRQTSNPHLATLVPDR
jgi:hypothetical protein